MANAIRALAMDAVEAAKSQIIPVCQCTADAATVLFANHLPDEEVKLAGQRQICAVCRTWFLLLYAPLYLTGQVIQRWMRFAIFAGWERQHRRPP